MQPPTALAAKRSRRYRCGCTGESSCRARDSRRSSALRFGGYTGPASSCYRPSLQRDNFRMPTVVSAYGCHSPVKVCPDGPLTNCCSLRAEVLPWMRTTLETIDILLRLAKAPVARDRKPLGAVEEAGATRFPLGRVGGGSGSDSPRNPPLRGIASRQRLTIGRRLRRDRDGAMGSCDDRVIPDFLAERRLRTSRFRDGHRSQRYSLRHQEPRCGSPGCEVHLCHPQAPRPRRRNSMIP